MTHTNHLQGLYAITDPCAGQYDELYNRVEQALAGGARILQYRDKSNDHARRKAEAASLQSLCREHHCLFIINDDIELAARVAADGVHIGKDDAVLQQARAQLGADAIIGVSCYNRIELALEAEAAGADYVAFGRFFSSSTKPEAVQADSKLLSLATQTLNLPLVAIGGITTNNAPELITAGADMLAVIGDLFHQPDTRAKAETFTSLFDALRPPR